MEENEELNAYTEKNSQLTWDMLDTYPNIIFKAIITVMNIKIICQILSKVSKKTRNLSSLYSKIHCSQRKHTRMVGRENLYWADDFHIANSMVVSTLKSFVANSKVNFNLFKVYKDDEDRKFIVELFRSTIRNSSETIKMVEDKATNWELDRIAVLDLVLLQMALTNSIIFQTFLPKLP